MLFEARLLVLRHGLFVDRFLWRRQTPRRRGHDTRLHALARIGEDRLRIGWRPGPGIGRLALQRADGAFEGQSQSAENMRGNALAVSNDRCQDDGAVDLAASTAPRRGGGSL
jgi:hypothetical protein